jgi:hypothetical protein
VSDPGAGEVSIPDRDDAVTPDQLTTFPMKNERAS